MLAPPLPLPSNLRWRIIVDAPRTSATRALIRVAGDLAEHQHGVVSRDQLLRLGFPSEAIQQQLRARLLRPLHAGVYAVGHREITEDGRRLAALLATGETGALGRRTAAAVLGYVDDRGDIDVALADGVHRERPGIAFFRSSTLVAADVMVLRRLAVTRPARTLIDFAAVAGEREAFKAADAAMRRGCSPAALREVVERLRRQPGRRAMARYLAARRSSALRLRSELERLAADLLLTSDLPRPQFNTLAAFDGELLEVDVWWPERRVVLELDGREYHEGVVAELEDARRDRILRGAGQVVHRAAWWDVDREPGRLLARIGRDLWR